MDEDTIRKLRSEVLSQLDAPGAARESGDLESRVAALEAAVAQILGRGGRALPVAADPRRTHPSLTSLDLGPSPSGDRCVMEPDKPCVQSHACRVLGH
jgi:hypothetical protein